MKARAAIILIEGGQVAMIERRRQDHLFYVFPGGHVETGELPTEAAVREAKEELGLEVRVAWLVAESTYAGRPHFYYLADCTGGEFGSGHGKELSRSVDSERGSVKPVWLPIADFDKVVIYPARIAQLISEANEQGWPNELLVFVEPESPIN
jgi:8-oxo-dGTP diphosphatase